jgi:hypothetical protein
MTRRPNRDDQLKPIVITRERIFRRFGRFQWVWVYAVSVPGEPYPFKGSPLSWARDIAKRYAHTGQTIIETWRAQ